MSSGMPSVPVVHLTIRRGPRPGQTLSASGPSVVIGRVPGNDIILDDPQVSRHHASLTFEGGQWVLRDLGSTNGTTVNGQPVSGQWVVRPGDVIGLGDVLAAVQFSVGGVETATLAGARPPVQPAGAAAGRGRSWALVAIVAVLATLALVMTAVLLLVVFRRPASVPQVIISAPTNGVIVAPGSVVEVQTLATDEQGVTRIDLRADNVIVASQTAPDARGVSPFAAVLRWPAGAPGPHTLVATAYNAAGVASQPAVVLVNVAASAEAGTTPPPVVTTGTIAAATGTPDSADLLPTVTPTAVVPPTATMTPAPTPTVCVDNVAFVADVTVPDGTVVTPGQRVDKVWRLRNSGNCRWGAGYSAVFVSGSQMSGASVVPLPETAAGATVDVVVTLTAPGTPGTYTGYWQLRNAAGALFGRPFLVQVVVPAPPTVTPEAVISFSADRLEVRPGECAVLTWNVENVSAVYLGDEGVVGQGNRTVCPGATTTYTLRVVRRDGGTEERRVTITVTLGEVPRPNPVEPPDRVEYDRFPRDLNFLWSEVSYPGGVSYSIEIQWGSPEGTNWERWILVEGLDSPTYYMDSFVGAYNVGRWRVWAVSRATGQSSAKTDWRYFRFLQ